MSQLLLKYTPVQKITERSIYVRTPIFDVKKSFCFGFFFQPNRTQKYFYYMHFLNLSRVNSKITADHPNTCRFVDLQKVKVCTSSSTFCGFLKCLPHCLLGKTSCCLKLVTSHSESLLCIKKKLLFPLLNMCSDFFHWKPLR